MPIFYNFHILFATFYTIFGTNILIQCRVPVPVCCMFFVSQNIHTKRSPNAIKNLRGFVFGIFMIFWKKNQLETMPEGVTSPLTAAWGWGSAWQACEQSLRRLGPFFHRKKDNIWYKIVLKFQPNRSYGFPEI